ncbi:hypothetical protein PENSPDRAFT_474004 [Peniophora sp. CONT]|nr:hypothetical protein PENSPDRAFT_474004 [Peniophora sp. CONT]
MRRAAPGYASHTLDGRRFSTHRRHQRPLYPTDTYDLPDLQRGELEADASPSKRSTLNAWCTSSLRLERQLCGGDGRERLPYSCAVISGTPFFQPHIGGYGYTRRLLWQKSATLHRCGVMFIGGCCPKSG